MRNQALGQNSQGLFPPRRREDSGDQMFSPAHSKRVVANPRWNDPLAAEPTGHDEVFVNPEVIVALHFAKV